jgi:catechol 2,3-dioxygenase-like lactoylglutathione lyase family enzyme
VRLYLVELAVSDWPAAVAWYADALGLEVTLRDEANRFALLGAGQGRLALKEGQPAPGSTRLAFEVDDLDAALAQLARHGVAPDGPVKASAEGYRRAHVRGPDGQRLCLFEWFRKVEAAAGGGEWQ